MAGTPSPICGTGSGNAGAAASLTAARRRTGLQAVGISQIRDFHTLMASPEGKLGFAGGSVLAEITGNNIASELINQIGPALHHLSAFFQILCLVVTGSHLI